MTLAAGEISCCTPGEKKNHFYNILEVLYFHALILYLLYKKIKINLRSSTYTQLYYFGMNMN